MKTAPIFLALVALTQAGVPMRRVLDVPKTPFNHLIINGEDAEKGEIPYQVSIQYRDSNFHLCGGSILNANYIITAAHCVSDVSASEVQVIAGTINLDDPKSVHLAVEIIVHEQYNVPDSWVNDIALVKVETPFVVSNTIKFVPLPESGQEIPAKSVAVVSGWGTLWEVGESPRELQRATIQIAAQDFCSEAYGDTIWTIRDTQVCAFDPVEETGSCHGDSGGPLTVNGQLVGVVSWANGCASTIYPTVYTRVPAYIDWINENAI